MNAPQRHISIQKSVSGQRSVFDFDSAHSAAALSNASRNTSVTIQKYDSRQEVTPLMPGPPSITVTVTPSEPMIPGTDIPLYRISALLDGGMSQKEVLEDFPSLTASQVALAREYAKKYPNKGYPYPKQSLKRLLRNSGFAKVERELKRSTGRSARGG
jgi:uncharacterized protein (DUF433 family)